MKETKITDILKIWKPKDFVGVPYYVNKVVRYTIRFVSKRSKIRCTVASSNSSKPACGSAWDNKPGTLIIRFTS